MRVNPVSSYASASRKVPLLTTPPPPITFLPGCLTGRRTFTPDSMHSDAAPARDTFRAAMTVPIAVAIAHGMNDVYAAFLHPLLPRIMERLDLNVAMAATLAMTLSLAASLIQPTMGLYADRFGRRLFVIGGPILSAVFMSLIGVAPSFIVLALFLALAGIGSAAFHPPGASLSAGPIGGRRNGARYALFSFGGSLGYALGPIIAVTLVARGGLEGLWVAMIPMLLFAPVLALVLPSGASERAVRVQHEPIAIRTLLRGPLGLVFGVSVIGAFIQRVFLTFQPIMVSRAGGTEAAGATLLSIYLGAQALGSIGGGVLADHMDRRKLLLALTIWSLPAHWLVFALPHDSPLVLPAIAIAGFLNMALLPPIVLLAQELVPKATSLGAGIVMGLAWATGSVMMLAAGFLADQIGVRAASLASVPVMLVGIAFAVALTRTRGAHEE